MLQYSKIGKVMKKISQLDDSHIPEKDGQFNFRERASKLVNQWQQILNTRSGDSEAGAAVNGTEKTDAAPETSNATVEGDTSMMTEP